MLQGLIALVLLWLFFPKSAAQNPYAVIGGVLLLIVALAAVFGG